MARVFIALAVILTLQVSAEAAAEDESALIQSHLKPRSHRSHRSHGSEDPASGEEPEAAAGSEDSAAGEEPEAAAGSEDSAAGEEPEAAAGSEDSAADEEPEPEEAAKEVPRPEKQALLNPNEAKYLNPHNAPVYKDQTPGINALKAFVLDTDMRVEDISNFMVSRFIKVMDWCHQVGTNQTREDAFSPITRRIIEDAIGVRKDGEPNGNDMCDGDEIPGYAITIPAMSHEDCARCLGVYYEYSRLGFPAQFAQNYNHTLAVLNKAYKVNAQRKQREKDIARFEYLKKHGPDWWGKEKSGKFPMAPPQEHYENLPQDWKDGADYDMLEKQKAWCKLTLYRYTNKCTLLEGEVGKFAIDNAKGLKSLGLSRDGMLTDEAHEEGEEIGEETEGEDEEYMYDEDDEEDLDEHLYEEGEENPYEEYRAKHEEFPFGGEADGRQADEAKARVGAWVTSLR